MGTVYFGKNMNIRKVGHSTITGILGIYISLKAVDVLSNAIVQSTALVINSP